MNSKIATVFFMLCVIPTSSHAGIRWDSASSFSIYGNGATNNLLSTDRLGHSEFSLGLDSNLPGSDASIKTTFESYIHDGVYKNWTTFHIDTIESDRPGQASIGSLNTLQSSCTVDQITTIEIVTSLNGNFRPFLDDYKIRITDSHNNTVFEVELGPPSIDRVFTVQLDPGEYLVSEQNDMISLSTNRPTSRSFGMFTSISVVPTPHTLGAIAPLGLLFAQRRRSA